MTKQAVAALRSLRRSAHRSSGIGATDGDTSTRAHAIRAALEHDIISGKLEPGSKLEQESLAERFGVSRTPVREALKLLTSGGLVEIKPRKGVCVAQLTVVGLAEMFETMAYLEASCAAMDGRRNSMADRAALTAAHQSCDRASRRGDPDAFYKANVEFHECIYRASHNGFLEAQTVALRDRLEAYRREATFHPGLMTRSMEEHQRMLDAILAMDEDGASKQMRLHLDTLRNDAISMAEAVVRRNKA
jgi:DNA-binding GntR family transcriptional regulator